MELQGCNFRTSPNCFLRFQCGPYLHVHVIGHLADSNVSIWWPFVINCTLLGGSLVRFFLQLSIVFAHIQQTSSDDMSCTKQTHRIHQQKQWLPLRVFFDIGGVAARFPCTHHVRIHARKSPETYVNSFGFHAHGGTNVCGRWCHVISYQIISFHVKRNIMPDQTKSKPYILYIYMCIYNTSSTAQGGGGSFKNRKPIGEIGCCESGMAERIHWWTERCLRSPLFLSLSLTIYLPTNLSSMYLSIDRSIYLFLSLFHLITYLPIYLSICLSIYLSLSLFHLSV